MITPGSDAWLMIHNMREGWVAWQRLPDPPYGLYQHSLVASPAGEVFGGHLFVDSKGKLPFDYVNSVHRLALEAIDASGVAHHAEL